MQLIELIKDVHIDVDTGWQYHIGDRAVLVSVEIRTDGSSYVLANFLHEHDDPENTPDGVPLEYDEFKFVTGAQADIP